MMKTVVIDDEFLAVTLLEKYLSGYDSMELAASFTDPREALQFLSSNDVDLVFLDIQMPGINGIELAKHIKPDVMVVFTTARSDFAVKAFELNVLDYVVKPVSPERFDAVIRKAADMFSYHSSRRKTDFIMIRADHRFHKLPTAEIIEIEGFGEYVKVRTNESTLITLATLSGFEEELDPTLFVRVHKSHIVSLQWIVSRTANSVSLTNGRIVPVGRTYKNAFDEAARKFGLIKGTI